MEILKKLNARQLAILKTTALAVVLFLVVFGSLRIFDASFTPFTRGSREGVVPGAVAPSMPAFGYEQEAPSLSYRNVLPVPPGSGGTTGSDAEKFEVTEYSAYFESSNLDETCGAVVDLKKHDYVIFENSSEADTTCSYTFKVAHARVPEVLEILKQLDPKDLNEETFTIKNQIEDFTSETQILEKKRTSIDETLRNALSAYDQITSLAIRAQNPDALAKIIDNKLQLIERLTQERLSINEQLDRLSRARAQQLDRLEYTYFNVTVVEKKFIDGESLRDSWKQALRGFVRDLNAILQGLTVNLVLLLLVVLQFLIYFFILMVIAKYVWRATRRLWKS